MSLLDAVNGTSMFQSAHSRGVRLGFHGAEHIVFGVSIRALAWSAIVNFASTNLNLGFPRQFSVCSAHQSPLLPYCGLDAPVKYIQFYVRL